MGLFKKKGKNKKKGDIPQLPELPKFPELPEIGEEKIQALERSVSQLPSFPTNSLGEKFSQNTIKKAVTGKKEDEGVFEADEFVPTEEEMRMMQKPLKKLSTKEISYGGRLGAKKIEPVFIRIDKFEEGLQIFEKTKKQITEIEKMLGQIHRIKSEEEKELEYWENELNMIKGQIEKVDEDIFSKIE